MLTAWILGSFFFVFILCFIVYVLATDVSQPEPARQGRANMVGSSANDLVADSGKCLISRDYQVVFGPRVFVDYPFAIRVVFAKSGTSEPVIWKPPEVTGDLRSNVQRSFRESEYYGWPQSALEDPELMVIGGHVEFESEEVEPTIRVELKSARESFQAIKAAEERVLKRDEDTIFSFWLNPLESEMGSLVIGVSHVVGTVEATPAASNGKNRDELAEIPLTVPVTFFPIALR